MTRSGYAGSTSKTIINHNVVASPFRHEWIQLLQSRFRFASSPSVASPSSGNAGLNDVIPSGYLIGVTTSLTCFLSPRRGQTVAGFRSVENRFGRLQNDFGTFGNDFGRLQNEFGSSQTGGECPGEPWGCPKLPGESFRPPRVCPSSEGASKYGENSIYSCGWIGTGAFVGLDSISVSTGTSVGLSKSAFRENADQSLVNHAAVISPGASTNNSGY